MINQIKLVMKGIRFASLVVLLLGCGKGAPPAENPEKDPSLGVQEALPGTPELVRTEVKDGRDRVIATGYLLNGKKESSWVEYLPHNKMISTITTYVQGKKEGLFIEFNNNQIVRQFFYHNDVRHGEYREFSGATMKELRYYEMGKQDGLTVVYYDNGQVMEEGYYKQGLRDGVSKWYDQNGKLSIEYEYKKGELVKK